MVTGKPCKNTSYFGFSCSYLKNEHVDPIVNRGTGYETLKPSKARTMLSPTIIKIRLELKIIIIIIIILIIIIITIIIMFLNRCLTDRDPAQSFVFASHGFAN